jgi:2-polyprenyl-3-methyl-5-hydroxy-6-metoxy-1,4-benzoquinol methylase
MTDVISPITQTNRVTLEAEFDVNILFQDYKAKYQIDVSEYFHNLDSIQLYRCNETGYRFYYPFTLSGKSNFYEALQKSSWYYPSWKWENEIAFKEILKTDNVLDIGCGSGLFMEKLLQNNIKTVGIEFNDIAIKKCLEIGLDVKKQSVKEHSLLFPNRYEVVCLFQVLEHIASPQEFINDCIKLLKIGGKLIIGVPNNNPYLFKKDKYHTLNLPPHHMGLWNKESLIQLAKYNQLQVENIVIEPLFDLHYYLKVNYGIPLKIGNYVKRLNFLSNFIDGRNIIAILKK